MSEQHRAFHHRSRCGGLACAPAQATSMIARAVATAAAMAIAIPAIAADFQWAGPNLGAYETAGNWSPNFVPGGGDQAFVNNGTTALLTTDRSLFRLHLGNAAGASGALTQTAGTLNVGDETYIGGLDAVPGGTGTYNLNGGTLNTTWFIRVGHGGTGTLNIGASATAVQANGPFGIIYIGGGPTSTVPVTQVSGNGTVVQNGGLVKSSGWVVMAGDPTATANYTLNAGTLDAQDFYIGEKGPATLTVNGGTVKSLSYFRLGENIGSQGTLNMHGGTLTTGAPFIVGHFSPAGPNAVTNGIVNMDGGMISVPNFNLGQHPNAKGIVNQSGGIVKAGIALVIAEHSTQDNVYDASGNAQIFLQSPDGPSGYSSLYAASSRGVGTLLVRDNAQITVDDDFIIGGGDQNDPGSTAAGTVTISGGRVEIGVAAAVGGGVVANGNRGQGTLNISGGQLIANFIELGRVNDVRSRGQATQTGGTVTVHQELNVGEVSNNDNFYQITGGTLNVAGQLTVARFSGTDGPIAASNGRLTIGGTAAVTVTGQLGNSPGGTIQPPGDPPPPLVNVPGGTGLIQMNGGTLTAGSFLNGSMNPDPGSVGSATYTQTGGTANVGHVTGTGTVNVSGGTMTVRSLRQKTLSVTGGALLVSADGTDAGTSAVDSLTVSGTGKFDLNNNDLVVRHTGASPIADVRADIIAGRNGGAWNGNGLASAAAAAEAVAAAAAGRQARYGLGYAEAADLGVTTFSGQDVSSGAVAVKFTYLGDADIDGLIDPDDFANIDRAVAMGRPASWANGDFNYSGSINSADYLIIDSVFAQQTGILSPDFLAMRQAQFGSDYVRALVTSVPEPSTGLAAAATVTAAAACRRKRKLRR